DLEIFVLFLKRLPDDAGYGAKEFYGGRFGDDHGMGCHEGGARVALEEGKGEDAEQVAIRIIDLVLIEVEVSFFVHIPSARGEKACCFADIRTLLLQGSGRWCLGIGDLHRGFIDFLDKTFHPVDAVRVFVEAVKAQFLPHVKDKKDAKADTDGQAEDVEETVPLVPLEISQ